MRTVEITVYRFNELSEEAKEKAINKLRGTSLCHGWWEWIYEDAKDVKLQITGFDLDRNKHATGNFMETAIYQAIEGAPCINHKGENIIAFY